MCRTSTSSSGSAASARTCTPRPTARPWRRCWGSRCRPRAAYLRTLLCELERIHSHLLWLGVLARNIGFDTIFMYAWRDREIVAGHHGGAVRRARLARRQRHRRRASDIDARTACRASWSSSTRWSSRSSAFWTWSSTSAVCAARTQGIGHLSLEQVRRYCAVGPVARASGVDVDLRRDPRPPYDRLNFEVPTHTEGDVWARTLVRMQETIESVQLCREHPRDARMGRRRCAPRAACRPARWSAGRSAARRAVLLHPQRRQRHAGAGQDPHAHPDLPDHAAGPARAGSTMADVSVVLSGVDLCIACADR